jgi:hypothetical protein
VGGEVRGNYCTWNPLQNGGLTLSNGNLDSARATSSFVAAAATIGMSSGKWYWEHTCSAAQDSANITAIGIGTSNVVISTMPGFTGGNGWVYVSESGYKWFNGSGVSYGATWTNGDVVGIAFDADAGTLTFYKNGTSQGTAYTSLTSGPYFPVVSMYGTSTGSTNFGQRPFAYTAPSGFKALNTANLPAPLVTKPSDLFDVKLYTGNGGTQTISGLGFSPDLVWIKSRVDAFSHRLQDTVRGVKKELSSDLTTAEYTYTVEQGLTAFNSDGFTLIDGATANGAYNKNNSAFVAWAWDAGTTTTTNTVGSISSQVRANASAGFSVVTYTGTGANATVGHGLGVAPGLIILKDRTSAYNWQVYHSTFAGTSNSIVLNSTAAVDTGSGGVWNSTAPTSTVFSIGTSVGVNTNGNNYVAYAFSPVAGYSSFGSYTGGGSEYPFVYCGFRPRWIMIKNASTGGTFYDWHMVDTARNPYNFGALNSDSQYTLFANTSGQEQQWFSIDILSNGFRVIDQSVTINNSGSTFIYAAFAEHPFQYARAR